MYVVLILCSVIIILVIVLSFLKQKLKQKLNEGFEECLLNPSCKCDFKKKCSFEEELKQCNNDLLNIDLTCKLEMSNALKHSDDLNSPFIDNSKKLQDEIDTNEQKQYSCKNEYEDLYELNNRLKGINAKYKGIVDKLNSQLSDIMNINSDACE